MPTLRPLTRALVPVDSDAAQKVSSPNYDEFQSDQEIFDLIQERPENVLRVTMAHCAVDNLDQAPEEGSDEALAKSADEMQLLRQSPLMKEVENVLWVYEIVSPLRPDKPQLGVGGYGLTSEIRTEEQPEGTIIRNEGIRPEKAEGRARLLKAVNADFGTVNLAVRDDSGWLLKTLEEFTQANECDFEATDEGGNRHRSWMVTDPETQDRLIQLVGEQRAAYVADGNHRSAAAAQLGLDHFLTVFFSSGRLGLEPYNRLLPLNGVSPEEFLNKMNENFSVQEMGECEPYRPDAPHRIGLYLGGKWYDLVPMRTSYDPTDAAQTIDADIIQRHVIDYILGMSDARDKRINYVGGNKDAAYLVGQVDSGKYDLAISLAPVTMMQFMAVCEQNKFMPPKSTWFDPKVRSGLAIALLD
ncbi:MAG: DUF1015 domain-containing protein [Planctomycetaceae bacterium]|nr:DUF1015 domain-containing protein [Planctomycetaceae bacterium]